MVLPAFTPARSIFPAVNMLPMQEQRGITNGNGKLNFTSKIRTRIQSCIAARNIETRTSLDHQGDFITAEFESQTNARIGVVAHIHSIGFPTLTVIDGQINTIHKILETITQAEVHISITQCPDRLGSEFILQALNVLTLVFGDVIGIPGQLKT